MKPGESHRHHRRLRKEETKSGGKPGRRTLENWEEEGPEVRGDAEAAAAGGGTKVGIVN